MKIFKFLFFTAVTFSLLSFSGTTTAEKTSVHSNVTSRDIMSGMLQSIDKIKSLKYTFISYERINGSDFFTEMDVKLSMSPFRVHMVTKSDPNKGVIVVYEEGKNDNKAQVNPGKWLPNVKLNPYGSKMRDNQHHTIHQSGFNFLAQIIRDAIKRADKERPGQFESFFRLEGEETWNGKKCYKLVIDDPEFDYVNYTVKPGEDINSIAKSKGICGYLIVEKNDNVKNFDALKPGMTVKIPTSYAKKTILYIDKLTNMPVVQIMYDEVGQFEKYEFLNLQVNPAISDSEFSL